MADNFNFVDQDNPLTVRILGSGKEGGEIVWNNLTVTRISQNLVVQLTTHENTSLNRISVYEHLPTDDDLKFMKEIRAGEDPYLFELPPPETSEYAVLFIFTPFPRQAVVFAHVASRDSPQTS